MDDRYSRQILFSRLGKVGQEKLEASSVVIVGCGGLGSAIATTLVRAGVGRVKVVDKDIVEYHNLHRQILYDEEDVRLGLPKAVAAERHLRKVNSSVQVEGVVAEVGPSTVEELVKGADVILDGLDNFKTRFVVNEASLKHNIPWVYGGVVASLGMTMTIIPHQTPCLRCRFQIGEANPFFTSERVGVIGPAPFIIGSFQAVEAMKILTGDEVNHDLIFIDVWRGTFERLKIARREDCPPCGGRYEFLKAGASL